MPIFFYQSLNSNSSSQHGISASKAQRFTRDTHDAQAASSEAWKLSMPTAPGASPEVPVHGPAQLVKSAAQGYMGKGQHSDHQFLAMVEGKARDTHQHLVRQFGRSCDILVYGELDGNNAEWSSMQSHAGNLVIASSTGKACNSFSVHASNTSNHEFLGSGMGWIAIKSGNVNAVFVHVPNAIAKSEDAAVSFYQTINRELVAKGKGAIDIVMGDTNQSSPEFTPRVLSRALGAVCRNATKATDLTPVDSHNRSFKGTNSNATKMYDVAVYNSASVSIGKEAYLSQSTAVSSNNKNLAAAVTDHMGIAIEVTKTAS
ncbi:hypothetical protein [Simiduia litorea]|uniref:hypothetical protein n=1 Tax=Simiduia litorea TaxID=1435348 RepID=UPI0036F2DFDF